MMACSLLTITQTCGHYHVHLYMLQTTEIGFPSTVLYVCWSEEPQILPLAGSGSQQHGADFHQLLSHGRQ